MRVLHVIISISRAAGGPARSVQGLVAGLNDVGVEALLLSLKHGEEPWVDGVEHFVNGEAFEKVATRIRPDIVHLHCLWSPMLHRCAVICRLLHIPYIIAPRGMLEPWSLKQKWLKKRIARWLYQDRDLRCAAALHATAESEAEQFRRLGFRNPVIVSPNGVNIPKSVASGQLLVASGKSPECRMERRVLFVSRMHPKKGVMELVEAWNSLQPSNLQTFKPSNLETLKPSNPQTSKPPNLETSPSWLCELVYTTNSDLEHEYEAKVKARVKELGLQDQFVFTGALDDEAKWEAYARADLFVLPTYSENFGIVVAEALWAGLPVITTKGTPWSELEGAPTSSTPPLTNSQTFKCGWWIDIGVEPLAKALEVAVSLTDGERHAMGACGRKLVEERYTWNAVVKSLVNGYDEVLNARS